MLYKTGEYLFEDIFYILLHALLIYNCIMETAFCFCL